MIIMAMIFNQIDIDIFLMYFTHFNLLKNKHTSIIALLYFLNLRILIKKKKKHIYIYIYIKMNT
jgi:hypothetical protein